MLALVGLLALLGACLASEPARPTAQAAGLLPEQEAALLQRLATADRQWLPRAETLPSGAMRYHYRRRANEPRLSVAELRALIANPPSFGAERLAIGELLIVLAKAGVRLELGLPSALPDHLTGVLNESVYSQASEQERQLEREAYANQTRLNLGAQLVRRHCGT